MSKIFSLVAAFMVAISSGTGNTQAQTSKNVYPCTAVVIATDEATDTVTVKDSIGFTWSFAGVEDWAVGDGCNMLMDTNGTPQVADDIIVQAIYYRWNW